MFKYNSPSCGARLLQWAQVLKERISMETLWQEFWYDIVMWKLNFRPKDRNNSATDFTPGVKMQTNTLFNSVYI